jgi:hypothetical protein
MVRKSLLMCVLMMILPLCACRADGSTAPQERALAIRTDYLSADGCTAQVTLTADYGRRVYCYQGGVTANGQETVLTLTAPEEVAGVVARLKNGGSALEYDGAVVETGPLSDDGLTPLGAVPALLEAARSAFMDSSTLESVDGQNLLRVLCRDPALDPGQGQEFTLWFDPGSGALLQGELSLDGHRVITCQFQQFTLL